MRGNAFCNEPFPKSAGVLVLDIAERAGLRMDRCNEVAVEYRTGDGRREIEVANGARLLALSSERSRDGIWYDGFHAALAIWDAICPER